MEKQKARNHPSVPNVENKLKHPVRNLMYLDLGVFQIIYRGNGKCEHCGFKFKLFIDDYEGGDKILRRVICKPKNKTVMTFYDAGIEITVIERHFMQKPRKTQIFISLHEVRSLFFALQNKLAICFEQYDWDIDLT